MQGNNIFNIIENKWSQYHLIKIYLIKKLKLHIILYRSSSWESNIRSVSRKYPPKYYET